MEAVHQHFSGNRGMTLVELVAAVTIMGLIAGVVTLSIARKEVSSSVPPLTWESERAKAIHSGRQRMIVGVDSIGQPIARLFLPDGRIVNQIRPRISEE